MIMLFNKKESQIKQTDPRIAEMQANIESLLEMTIDLNERVRLLEGIMVDEGLTAKVPPEIDERGIKGLLTDATELVQKEKQASVAFLQKSFRISHIRAFRLLETLEEDGVVGPYRGIGKRVVNQNNN